MGSYAINELCYRTVHDVSFREGLQNDPVATLAANPLLTDEERAAFLAGDIGQLYLWGGHPYLLGHLMRERTGADAAS
jgi:hypothetical protein